MKTLNCNTKLKTMKDEDLKDADGVVFTVGNVLSTIMSGRVSNPTLGWQFGKKFATQKNVDLKAEDIVFIKKEVEENAKNGGFPAVISGQVLEILDSK